MTAARAASGEVAAEVSLDQAYGWRRLERAGLAVWLKGYEQTRDPDRLADEAAACGGGEARLAEWLRGLDGFFSVVLEGAGWTLAAVDRVRSMPLIWARRDGRVTLTQDGPWLAGRLGLGPADVNPDGTAALAQAGFTIGADTIYRGVRQLLPGQYLLACGGAVTVAHYHQWRPWRPDADADPADLAAPLAALHERLIEKLAASANGREILVPLSAGLDSRMILSGLVEAGYPRLRAFAYGLPGNREAVVSRQVAAKLGVPWEFVPYSNAMVRRVHATEAHARYRRYADSLTGIHFPQDYPALDALLGDGRMDGETVVVNGQSGDFITGNHVLPPLTEPAHGADPAEREARVIDALIRKHFKQWAALATLEALAPIRRRLSEEIAALGGMPENAAGDHGVYEYCEFVDRQSKYVVNGQRLYEYLGLDWRLPLWDRDCLDFWARAPLAAKRGQWLYREVLERANWGGVWSGVPVNPLRVRPAWLTPLRLALKALHAPLGRARWHRFETRYLSYWMAPLCSFAPWPWSRVARDRRGHATALAWYAAEYLEATGLRWDGRADG